MTAYLVHTDAVVSILTASPALAGGFIKRARAFPLPANADQGIFVSPAGGAGAQTDLSGSFMRWQTSIVVEMRARASAGDDGLQAIDTLVGEVFARLAAATPPAGGQPWTASSDVAFDFDEADQTVGQARLVLRVDHFTGPASLDPAT